MCYGGCDCVRCMGEPEMKTPEKKKAKRPLATTNEVQALLDYARKHHDILRSIEERIAEILNVPNDGYSYYGHVSDAIWSDSPCDAKELLRKIDKQNKKNT